MPNDDATLGPMHYDYPEGRPGKFDMFDLIAWLFFGVLIGLAGLVARGI